MAVNQSFLLSNCATDVNEKTTENISDEDNKQVILDNECNAKLKETDISSCDGDVIEINVEKCSEDDDAIVDSFFTTQPISTLDDLAVSDYLHNRQLAVRKILEFLKQAGSDEKELQSVISVMCKLSEDEEAVVQFELMQQVPDIAAYCQSKPHLQIVIRQQLMPYTVRLLSDNQVIIRKSGQSALLILLEKKLIDQAQLIEWICPLITQLVMSDCNLEELRLEDVSFMTRMIPLVKRDIALKFFLDPFVSLCCDSSSGVRKICALGFGIMCKVVGTESTEQSLLPAFLNLCNDEIWQVRRACASVFVDVANTVTLKTREDILPHVFVNLLTDNHNNVKFGAYQSLGTFIYTFADSKQTGCSYEDGKIVFVKQTEFPDGTTNLKAISSMLRDNNIVKNNEKNCSIVNTYYNSGHYPKNLIKAITPSNNKVLPPFNSVTINSKIFYTENGKSFNNFQYWRNPLPEIELDFDNFMVCNSDEQKENGQSHITESKISLQTECSDMLNEKQGLLDDTDAFCSFKGVNLQLISEQDSQIINPQCTSNSTNLTDIVSVKKDALLTTPYEQDIVPPILLYSFVCVVNDYPCEINKASEDEKLSYIAYSFPAVALTLGKTYWPCIKRTCEKLARNMKWTIRRTIALSLHDLATILGYDITISDLLPIFLDLFKDVDEVRLCLVQHLADFLKHLKPHDRKQFLPLIEDFAKVDNERNWRFRCAVAEQLIKTSELYDAIEMPEYFLPVASTLLHDKVSSVRLAAVELMAVLLKQLHQCGKMENYYETMLEGLNDLYRRSPKWIWRQTYIKLCEQFVLHETMHMSEFVEKVVPKLFSLAWDEVPNVRLSLVCCLSRTLIPFNFLSSIESSPYHELLIKMLKYLQLDVDKDVRYFAEQCCSTS